MYTEDQYIQLSALQHYMFCRRQCALAYMEMIWAENLFTAEGRIIHEKVHSGELEKRGGIIRALGLWIASARLGLSGQTDLTEFHRTDEPHRGIALPGYKGKWQIFPVEFKRGKPKADHSDEVQLCAQALCLEEMLNCNIGEGAIFYGKNKRRHPVVFTDALRTLTEKTSREIHEMFAAEKTPAAIYSKKCKPCSLYNRCLPRKTGGGKTVSRYLNRILEEPI
ncbi:MAG: CRISPR-associated protein Cas4 [Calditrichia bacterium]